MHNISLSQGIKQFQQELLNNQWFDDYINLQKNMNKHRHLSVIALLALDRRGKNKKSLQLYN
jgi:hypothetical protein